MMLACNCLNIIIEIENDFQKVKPQSLELSEEEKKNNFFNQDLIQNRKVLNVNKVHSDLVQIQKVGSWIINRCINCDIQTHAIHKEKGSSIVLTYSKLLNSEAISSIKSSDLYSKVFKIVVNPNDIDLEDEILDTYLTEEMETKIKYLSDVISSFIEKERIAVMDLIKRYSDEQFETLNLTKERAFKEQEALIRVIYKARAEPFNSNKRDIPERSPQKIPSDSLSAVRYPGSPLSEKHSPKRQKSSSVSKKKEVETREDLIFEFEGSDGVSSVYFSDTVISSDTEMEESDKDIEDEEQDVDTEPEGVTIQKPRGSIPGLAKSLPVNIPIFVAQTRSKSRSSTEDELPSGENVDIAASIKALAKSVHGDAVFGELPRPRFSTQI